MAGRDSRASLMTFCDERCTLVRMQAALKARKTTQRSFKGHSGAPKVV